MRRHVLVEAAHVLVHRRDERRELLRHRPGIERLERAGAALEHRVAQADERPQAETQAEPHQRNGKGEHDELMDDRLFPDLAGELAMRA